MSNTQAQLVQSPAPTPKATCQTTASHCDHCSVRERAICGALEQDALTDLGSKGRMQTVPKGKTLVWEGDDALLVANVIEGVLKLSTSTSDGREQIVGVVYPSDFIGRPFGERSQHSVTALVDSRVCLFPRAVFDHFASCHPELEHRLMNRAFDELDRARNWMLLLGRKSATERVASFLLEMSLRLGESQPRLEDEPAKPLDLFDLPLDRQQIADILGLTIETVSRQLSAMRTAGIIDLPSRRALHILDRDRLLAQAGS